MVVSKSIYDFTNSNYTPKRIYGREKEVKEITNIIKEFKSNQETFKNFIYISGLPGNGKTLVTKKILNDTHNKLEINAASLLSPKQLYTELLFFLKCKKHKPMIAAEKIDMFIRSSTNIKTKYILFIDEIDFIISKSSNVFFDLIDWISIRPRNFLLIGIANSMNLLEHLDKKAISRLSGSVKIPFFPYTYEQVSLIIKERISESKIFHEKAIEMISRKISNISGDIRKSMQLARASIDMWEMEGSKGKVTVLNVVEAAKEIFRSPEIQYLTYLEDELKHIIIQTAKLIKSTGSESVDIELLFKRCKLDDKKLFPINLTLTDFLYEVYKIEKCGLGKISNLLNGNEMSFSLNIYNSDIKYELENDAKFKRMVQSC